MLHSAFCPNFRVPPGAAVAIAVAANSRPRCSYFAFQTAFQRFSRHQRTHAVRTSCTRFTRQNDATNGQIMSGCARRRNKSQTIKTLCVHTITLNPCCCDTLNPQLLQRVRHKRLPSRASHTEFSPGYFPLFCSEILACMTTSSPMGVAGVRMGVGVGMASE